MDDELYLKVAKLRQLVIKSKKRFSEELKGKIYRVLLDSEALLLDVANTGTVYDINRARARKGYENHGSIELGAVLYWLNNPSAEWQLIVEDIVFILYLIEGEPLPKSALTKALVEKLREQNIIPDFIAEESAIYACSSIIPVPDENLFWLVENMTRLINPEPRVTRYGGK